jgi:tRNA U34 5-carboxymethylaminomethyl modifying enzyme MnmG/GidA
MQRIGVLVIEMTEMTDHDRLIRIDEGVQRIRKDIDTMQTVNERQWKSINTNSTNIKSVSDRFNDHVVSPHCGEDDETEEAAKAMVHLIKFFKSKQGKGTGLVAVVIAALVAAQQIGWI